MQQAEGSENEPAGELRIDAGEPAFKLIEALSDIAERTGLLCDSRTDRAA